MFDDTLFNSDTLYISLCKDRNFRNYDEELQLLFLERYQFDRIPISHENWKITCLDMLKYGSDNIRSRALSVAIQYGMLDEHPGLLQELLMNEVWGYNNSRFICAAIKALILSEWTKNKFVYKSLIDSLVYGRSFLYAIKDLVERGYKIPLEHEKVIISLWDKSYTCHFKGDSIKTTLLPSFSLFQSVEGLARVSLALQDVAVIDTALRTLSLFGNKDACLFINGYIGDNNPLIANTAKKATIDCVSMMARKAKKARYEVYQM